MIDLHIQQERASLRLRPLRIIDLGMIPYAECWERQRSIAEGVGNGNVPETLLLLEHPHTFTCGKRGGRDNILGEPKQLDDLGVSVLDVDRGGDVTYHGPGQLVAYPIINLRNYGETIDYPAYVRRLEDVLIDVLADFNVNAGRVRFLSGAWYISGQVTDKIAAIGVKVDSKGVTTHGIALNVNTDLTFFDYIIPCGIRGKGVTSITRLLGDEVDIATVKVRFTAHFERVFGFAHTLNPIGEQSVGGDA